MLYKPTNPSPYNSVVDQPTETSPLTFTASCVSTSSITGMRLAIKDNTTEYYLPIADGAVSQCKTTSGIAIPYLLKMFNSDKSCSIKTSNFTRTDGLSNEVISKIVQPLTSYRWQVRLYQGSTDINIGYGFVQDVINFNNSSKPNRRILKVRPHTNMFMGKSQRDEAFGKDDLPEYNKGWNKNLTEYYDDKVVYQIQFSGKSYNILNYYYSKEPAYYVGTKPTDLISEKQYDEPLFAFIEIDLKTGDAEIETGAEYTILTNYIDSNEYYFSCRQLGTLKFTDPRITSGDKDITKYFVSVDGLDEQTTTNTYSPTHSNVQIKGSFDSKSGATINYYKATLYQVLSNGEDIQIHDSGYVYSCKDLLDGNTYKLVITVNDSYGNSITQGVYITPKHGGIVKPTILSVEPYHAHNSIIIDFGKLLSIPGHESYQHDKSVVFNDLYGKYHTDTQTYTLSSDESVFNSAQSLDVGLYSGDTSSKDIDFAVRTCSIAPDNTVVYEDIDGTDEDIKCQNPLISMTFRCNDSDTQTIFDFLSDNGKRLNSTIMFRGYKLTWQNYRFCLTPYWRSEKPTMYIGTQKIYYTVYNTPKYYSPYGVVDETWATYVHDAMLRDAASDYSVPYLAFENIRMGIEGESEDEEGGGLYMHTESVAHDFWWQVIITPQQWYIKCLNPPQKNDSTEYYNWEGGGNL